VVSERVMPPNFRVGSVGAGGVGGGWAAKKFSPVVFAACSRLWTGV
jgi:hypothetical protein